MRLRSARNLLAILRLALGSSPEALEVARRIMQLEGISDPAEAYEARFRLLNRMARRWHFEMYNQHSAWQDDEAFWTAWKQFPAYTGQRPDRKFVVWSLARHARRLPGDTVECGVFEGASSHLICSAYRDVPGHRHHVFDSFQGLSVPGSEDDPSSTTARKWQAGELSASLEVVRSNLARFGSIEYYPGWIPERFDSVAERRFSFVHVDVDLYRPTRDSLEFFYPRLERGGILLCDDYGSHQCAGAKRAFDEFIASQPERTVIHLPTIQGFIIKA